MSTSEPTPTPRMTVRYIPSGTGIIMPENTTPEEYQAAINALLNAIHIMDEALDVVDEDRHI